PKGIFEISPVKRKPLFQIFAEKLLDAKRVYGVEIPWMIMTSHLNDSDTRKFFEERGFFGLNPDSVYFLKQGRMPAVTEGGKLILRSKNSLSMVPDGHGGCLRAMSRSGALAALKKRGVDIISYFQVDNPLVNIIDPHFVGFHILGGSQMSSKMIKKAYPLEKVGHFCVYEGSLCVVEYSDLPKEYQELRNPDGSIKFDAGSVAIHLIDLDFADRLGGYSDFSLPFHRANKKVAFADENGNPATPAEPNAIKFEMFVFDALKMARNPLVIEGKRSQEFSAVKNASGVDSPATCVRDQKIYFAEWLEKVGVRLERGADGAPKIDLEISPLFASNEEEFVRRWNSLNPKPDIKTSPFYLGV
ncbi:MAG: UTP--glucose-1-phosphate uridylyltransferase, partial [Opitutales bacterium]|nr:UTP--glucose-1-phosphate uridylyltransferase [Opitutales bacterium]